MHQNNILSFSTSKLLNYFEKEMFFNKKSMSFNIPVFNCICIIQVQIFSLRHRQDSRLSLKELILQLISLCTKNVKWIWLLGPKISSHIYNASLTIISAKPSRFCPLHLSISSLLESVIDNPIPHMQSLTAHSAKTASPVAFNLAFNSGF